jgi:hypothetical protein
MRAREQKSLSLQEHVVLPSPTYETSRTMSSPPPLGPKSGVKSDFVGGNVARELHLHLHPQTSMHNAVKSREKLPEHISDFTLINRPRPKPMKTRRRTQKFLNQNIKQQLAWRCASLVATYVLYKPSHTFSAVFFTPPFTHLYSRNLHYALTWFGDPKSSIFHSMKKDGNSMECPNQNSATKYAWRRESLLATLSKKKKKRQDIDNHDLGTLGVWESKRTPLRSHGPEKRQRKTIEWSGARQDAWEVFTRRLRSCNTFEHPFISLNPKE